MGGWVSNRMSGTANRYNGSLCNWQYRVISEYIKMIVDLLRALNIF